MSKTNEWVDGSRTPAQGTRERSLRGGWGAAWGRLAGVLAVGVGVGLGMGAGGEAKGQTLQSGPINPAYLKWAQEQEWKAKQEKSGSAKSGKLPRDGEEGVVQGGLIPSLIDYTYLSDVDEPTFGALGRTLPDHFDPRPEGNVTPIRNQDPNNERIGTCWAQGTVGSMEMWQAKNGVQEQFSVKNMVDRHGWNQDGWMLGGTAEMAMSYLLRWDGPVWEADDPYLKNGKVNRGANPPLEPVYHVQQVRMIPARTSSADNDKLKNAVLDFGGVWTTLFLDEKYLNSKNGAFYYPTPTTPGHVVTLVGWDDTYSKANFLTEPPGDGAFLVKDSYGTSKRDGGYIHVSYYDAVLGRYALNYAYPQLESTDNYAGLYQYDTLGHVDDFGYTYVSAGQIFFYPDGYMANMYTAGKEEELAAVGFYVNAPSTVYTIGVYTGCESGKPKSGMKALEQSGATDTYAGYYTFPLDQAVKVKKGERFSIVVYAKMTGVKATQPPLPVERSRNSASSTFQANSGESFVSYDGKSWQDMNGLCNFCIKAYTKGAIPPTPAKLSKVTIQAEDGTTIASGKTGRFSCDATYEDGVKKKGVAAKWSVVKGVEFASIDNTGLLTAAVVGENQTVTIQASYTDNGVTLPAEGDVTITAGAPGVPQNVQATGGLLPGVREAVRVTWDAVSGASSYSVWRKEEGQGGDPGFLKEVHEAKCSDTGADPGVYYLYYVKAKNGKGADTRTSDFSAKAKGMCLLTPPTDVKATGYDDHIGVLWSATTGAEWYRVARADEPTDVRSQRTWLGGWQKELSFADRTCEAGKTYYYYVAAAKNNLGLFSQDGEIPAEGRMAEKVVPESLSVEGPDSLGSGLEGNYEAFVVYSGKIKGKNAVSASWKTDAGSVRTSGTKGIVTAPVTGTSGKLTVTASATVDGVEVAGGKTVQVKPQVLGQVTGLKVTSETSAGIGLSWNAAEGAGGYVVARTGGKGGDATFKTGKTSYTDTTAEVGVEYSYTVSAENAAGGGTPSEPVAAFIGLSAPGGVSATAGRTDGVRVKWSGTAGATHFRVGRAASQSGTKTVLGSGWTAERSFDDVPPRDNTEYWYFVKAATGADGSHATGWSTGAKGKKVAEKTLTGLSVSGPDRVGSGESAVYSCLASWSGEEAETTVAAEWSATKGSIGKADGRFQAPSAEADTEVSIVAKYGGMAATQTVTVVGAGVEATAEITKVSAAQRWPFEGLVDIDYTLVTSPSGTKAVIAVSGLDEDHGTTLAATTLEGYGAGGAAVSPGNLRVTWDIGTDYPGLNAASVRVDVTAAVAAQGSVEGVTASGTADGIVLGWNAAEGATAYQVWRGTSSLPSGAAQIATVASAGHTDRTARAGTRYWYWIKAVSAAGVSAFSAAADAVRPPAAPTGVTATAGSGGIEVAWSASEGATGYEVWRNASNSTTGAEKAATVAGTSWTDSGAGAGTWYYWVKATCAAETSGFSAVASATGGLEVPVVTVRNATTTNGWALSVSWTAVDGAASYEVWRGTGDSFDAAAKRTTSAGTNWVDASVTANTTYTYWVVAKNGALEGRSEGVQGTPSGNLMPLRSLLTGIEAARPDGVLSDLELEKAMKNPTIACLDCDLTEISDEEMAVFLWIQRLNQDKDLISNVIKGNYSGISASTLLELFQLSETIRIMTDLTPCVTATQGTGSGALIRVSWGKRSSNILSYEVYRSTTTNGTPTLVATVTTTNWTDTDVVFRHPYWYRVKAVYETLTTGFSGKAKGYWGDWCLPDNNNLMPLRSLLTSIDAVKNLDGVLSETEMNRVMSNSTIIDMDGDPTKISDAEMSIFQRIKTLNQDPALITALIRGDYTYAGMSEAEFLECYSLSETIRALTKY
ncbi:MAG: hypothetical protein IKQ15_10185 [Kiritimatiellae bacterium]|nr:hypothetical protein [Kiritimatiellia bacterium]